jgi:hypothetical protein
VIWPEHVRKRTQQYSHVVLHRLAGPLLEFVVVQDLWIVPVVSLLLFISEKALKLFVSRHLMLLLLRLLLLWWWVSEAKVQIVETVYQTSWSLEWALLRLLGLVSVSENIHAVIICLEGREGSLSCKRLCWCLMLLLTCITKEFLSSCKRVFIPIRLLERYLLFIRHRYSLLSFEWESRFCLFLKSCLRRGHFVVGWRAFKNTGLSWRHTSWFWKWCLALFLVIQIRFGRLKGHRLISSKFLRNLLLLSRYLMFRKLQSKWYF